MNPRETLTRIRAQADAATDGPWEARHHHFADGEWMESSVVPSEHGDFYEDDGSCIQVNSMEADAEFIAAARTDVPRLVDALEKVLELHIEGRPFIGHGFKQRRCECGATWPCLTATAITRALTTA